ncbi:dihydropteroate synthase [Candidatus Providencia siddallii]|uniref:Dihydropteroate synthase n=1 Tax=Candidatus Providencia siddallii TaxID=1715285 RepID=A0ABP1CE30_9GAMM
MQINSKGRILDLSIPRVMGILNITPDSFSDGGKYLNHNAALNHASKMINEGASIIDIGGESTRPGYKKISINEELDRILPIIELIHNRFDIWISVDTYKAKVMEEAAKIGIHMINDIYSLHEKNTLKTAIQINLPICIMHINKYQKFFLKTKKNKNSIFDIKFFFKKEIKRCVDSGIKKNQLIIDPGFGFQKTLNDNYNILSNLKKLHKFKLPILVGMSRKTMIGNLLNIPPNKRLIGSITCSVIAAMQGIHIIRAHDVKETIEAIKIVQKTLIKKNGIQYV